VLGLPALVGGVLGGTVGPAVAWALLRDVPLGVAFVVTSVGTALGGIVGWYAGGTHDVLVAMYGAVIGLVLSAILLRLRHPARQRASV
jgi:ABC-type antimicrobial peptide transport system permease subunit